MIRPQTCWSLDLLFADVEQVELQALPQDTCHVACSMDKPPSSPERDAKALQVRTSGRIIKRPKRDLTPPPSPPKKGKKNKIK